MRSHRKWLRFVIGAGSSLSLFPRSRAFDVRFTEARIPGVWRIGLEKREDSLGFCARAFCEGEFGDRGLVTRYPQSNLSYNEKRGTIRGMHFQRPPAPEVK